MPFAIGASEFSLVLLLTVLVVVPIAAVAFARSGKALEELGKGRFAIDRDDDLGSGMTASEAPAAAERERAEEVRQMLEAADFRSQARGEGRIDVELEMERLMAGESDTDPPSPPESGIRAEIRQLVIANNERRERRGEEPLDVESEVERRMKEWG